MPENHSIMGGTFSYNQLREVLPGKRTQQYTMNVFREGDTNYLIRKYSLLWPSKIKKYGRNYKKIRRLYLKNSREGNNKSLWIKEVIKLSTLLQ